MRNGGGVGAGSEVEIEVLAVERAAGARGSAEQAETPTASATRASFVFMGGSSLPAPLPGVHASLEDRRPFLSGSLPSKRRSARREMKRVTLAEPDRVSTVVREAADERLEVALLATLVIGHHATRRSVQERHHRGPLGRLVVGHKPPNMRPNEHVTGRELRPPDRERTTR
jgi:hypothetical protein